MIGWNMLIFVLPASYHLGIMSISKQTQQGS
uniref:Uncharacterized protein n=1 Tax=Siphoviridae sp. ctmpG14 TaxID=2825654 RepID=A0A8S5PDA9_9CAUD|nr:MAG TPA: hypothetical protein [Siphoviridae sp. ctmpG14]